MPLLGTRTTVPTKSMGYSPGHGRVLRSARRSFARNAARRLAETRMAELERTQLGETEQREHATELAEMGVKSRMAELERTQLGETRRKGMGIAGTAERDRLAWIRGAGKTKVGGLAGAGDSTRMKSFDFANKAMSEMYPDRINPVTNAPFSSEAWQARTIELANSREAYGGIQPAGEQFDGFGGEGYITTEGGKRYDIIPGTGEIQESARFLPRVPVNRAAQMTAGAPAETAIPTETITTPTALEKWEKKYPRRKKIKGAMGGEDPVTTLMRSVTKPIDRSRLGRKYDYMSRFGSQQGYR